MHNLLRVRSINDIPVHKVLCSDVVIVPRAETVDKLVPRAFDKCQLRHIKKASTKPAEADMYTQRVPPRRTKWSKISLKSDWQEGNIQNLRCCCSSSSHNVQGKLESRRCNSLSDAKSDNFSKHGSHRNYEWFNTCFQKKYLPVRRLLANLPPFFQCMLPNRPGLLQQLFVWHVAVLQWRRRKLTHRNVEAF